MIISLLFNFFCLGALQGHIGKDFTVSLTANTATDVALSFETSFKNLVPLHNSISISSTSPASITIDILGPDSKSIYTKTVEGVTIFEYGIYLEQTNTYTLKLTSNVATTLKVLVEPLHQEYLGTIDIKADKRVVYIKEFLTLESATVLLADVPPGVNVHYTVCNGMPSNPVLTTSVCSSSAKVITNDGKAMFFFHAKTVFPLGERVGSNIWFFTFTFDLPSTISTTKDATIAFFSIRRLDMDTVTNITYPLQLNGQFVSISAFDSVSVVYKDDTLVTPNLHFEVSLPSEFVVTSVCVSSVSPFDNCESITGSSSLARLSVSIADFKPGTLYYLAVFCVLAHDQHESTIGVTSVKLTMVTEVSPTPISSTHPSVYKAFWYENTVYDKLFSPSRQIHLKFTIPSTGSLFEGADIYIDYHPVDPTSKDTGSLCRYSTRITSADMQTIYYYDILHNMHVYKAKPGTYYLILHPQLMCLNTGEMSIMEATIFIKQFSTENSFNKTQLIERHQLTTGILFNPTTEYVSPATNVSYSDLISPLVSFSAAEELVFFYNREYVDDNVICFELAAGSPANLLVSELTRYPTFTTNQSVYTKRLDVEPNCFSISKSHTNTLGDSALSTVLTLKLHSNDGSAANSNDIFFCAYSMPSVIKEYIIVPSNLAFTTVFPDTYKMVMSFRPLTSLVSAVMINYSIFIIPANKNVIDVVPTTFCGALTAITYAPNPAWRKPVFTMTRSVKDYDYIVVTIPLSQFPVGTDPYIQEYNAFVIVEDVVAGTSSLYISSRIKYTKLKLTKPATIQLSIACVIIILSVVGLIITAIFCGRMLNLRHKQKLRLV